jgi:L-cysteine desulfidase
MVSKEIRNQIIALVHQEVVPAIGCTEPMCVALCTAKATEQLGCRPERIEARLSANILKNAMSVGIPGTGMIGLPIAIALGALIGKSQYQLEVLKDLTPEALEEGKRFVAEDRIDIKLKEGVCDKLYVEMTVFAGDKKETAIIAGSHTHFVTDASAVQHGTTVKDDEIALNMQLVWDFSTTAPLEEIQFIEEARKLNMNAARESLKGNYGHNLGKTIDRPLAKGIFGNSI